MTDSLERSFPCAVILAERAWPLSSITIYGMIGGPGRFVLIPLDGSQDRRLYRRQVLTEINHRLREWGGMVPGLGAYTGFVINYSSERAVRFDREGKAAELLREPVLPGQIKVTIGRVVRGRNR